VTEEPVLTVVVATWNSAAVLPGLLAGLPGALEGVGAHELVVADNASSDGTIDAANQFSRATIVRLGHNGGYAAALNAGLAAARSSQALLVLNPDVRLEPGSVARLMQALQLPGTGIAVPRLLDEWGRLQHSLRREPAVRRALAEALIGGRLAGRYGLGEVVIGAGRYDRTGSADWASGAAMLISRPCLDAVGPWDESFFLYSEETDFALRARDAGFALRYVPDAVAVHLGGDSHRSPRLWSILVINRVRLFARRHGRARTVAFWGAVTLNEGLRALAGRQARVHRAGFLALIRPSRQPQEVRR
jgi:N-acetylglucosaminyl-diphospho-decaprenol L-rhamnosyltransferase